MIGGSRADQDAAWEAKLSPEGEEIVWEREIEPDDM
jgi:hypothetical protein